MVGLESVQTQLAALMARDDAEASTMVRESLAELQRPRTARSMERLARAWEVGDLNELETYADWCDCVNTPMSARPTPGWWTAAIPAWWMPLSGCTPT